jgi:hypothetical protein
MLDDRIHNEKYVQIPDPAERPISRLFRLAKVLDTDEQRVLKNFYGDFKREAVLDDVLSILSLVPLKAHVWQMAL